MSFYLNSPGSVVASFILVFKTNDDNATWPLKVAISNGKLGDFDVEKKSLQLSNGMCFCSFLKWLTISSSAANVKYTIFYLCYKIL